jgi:CRP-like cAMP-binding protein
MIPLEKLKEIFPFAQQLSNEDLFNFFQHVKVSNINQGEIFIQEGSQKKSIYFIKSGLIRSFYINEKSEEITNRLRYENQIVASHEIIVFNKSSEFNYQAIEKTELFELNFEMVQKIIENNPKLEAGRRYFVTQTLAEALSALNDFILLNPEQRYLKFVKENPTLINRVPNKYVANILGITPVSLSRIRKRISSKKR